jgi:hypothetical protein
MLERAQVRLLPIANRAADSAPMATACCNACRTCVQTNLIALGLAGIAGVGALLKRLISRGDKPLNA